MSRASSAPITEAEVRNLSTAEIQVNLERCGRLISQSSLLQRLPDGGEGIHRRRELFSKELERRRAVEMENSDEHTRAAYSTVTEARKRDNEAALLSEASHGVTEAAREMAEKYEHQRVDVEATVRRMYEGVLSEKEIQRILRSVPPHFFLTYAETCERERRLAMEARKAELQKLAAQAARHRAALP
ncbi:hypothetical protein LSCM1_06631 [Leishmania martiniquensis]|uniref:Uncharacterized protein n=1 Tax=Leishmania martiniquensis TaxID=1580590 RepID=A0A836KVX3_9TRYP|nr:hypothetical protein LSCM1_06631 [Leishmania martiniquensis]